MTQPKRMLDRCTDHVQRLLPHSDRDFAHNLVREIFTIAFLPDKEMISAGDIAGERAIEELTFAQGVEFRSEGSTFVWRAMLQEGLKIKGDNT